jgi:4'-phosphopantetheinyl transferase
LQVDSVAPDELALAYQSLTVAEQKRFHAYRLTADKTRFSLGRLLLRKIVEESMGQNLSLEMNDFGKPKLTSAQAHFSISHSGNVVLIAVSTSKDVGVGVEQMMTLKDREDLQSIFHPAEIEDINSLPVSLRERAFYECWARKEAISKAYGHGLSLPLKSYRVSCLPEVSAQLLEADWGVENWTLLRLDVQSGYAGALAIRSTGAGIRCFSAKLTA